MSTIRVGDNENLENALRRFKRKCSRDGIIGDLRKKEFYEKPSVKKRKKAEAAKCRNREKNRETEQKNMERTLKSLAKEAKARMKKGFWRQCEEELDAHLKDAREQGISESRMERYFKGKVAGHIKGEAPDEFYLKVKKLLLEEGEVSDAIGRLTDKEYYATLSYAEKQRYTLELSEKYLKALERFKREEQFERRKQSKPQG